MKQSNNLIICAEWEKRPETMRFEKVVCSECGCDLAMQAENVKFVKSGWGRPMCLNCCPKRATFGGVTVDGVVHGVR